MHIPYSPSAMNRRFIEGASKLARPANTAKRENILSAVLFVAVAAFAFTLALL